MYFTLFLTSSALTLGAPIPKELKVNVSVDGKWKCINYSSSGNPIAMNGLTWTIKGDELTIDRENVKLAKPRPYLFKAQKDQGPNAFEYKISAASTPRQCYVEMKGDTMKVAMPSTIRGERPKGAEPGMGVIYYEFQRVK